jgi:DNA-binding MarR family transcriptional regulator
MCLWVLGKYPDGLTATELSHECCLDKALISRAIKKLADMGAVFYDRPEEKGDGCRSHRRRNYRIRLKLSHSGADMSQELVGVADAAAASARHGLDGHELEQLCQSLAKLNENLKEYLQQLHTGNSVAAEGAD